MLNYFIGGVYVCVAKFNGKIIVSSAKDRFESIRQAIKFIALRQK